MMNHETSVFAPSASRRRGDVIEDTRSRYGCTPWVRSSMALALILLTIATAARAASSPVAIPGTASLPDDTIGPLAIGSSTDGLLHVIWQVGSDREVRYVKGSCANGDWSTPDTLIRGLDGPLRLLTDGPRLYLMIGPRLTLFVSTDNGASWTNAGDILDSEPPALDLDALLLGETLVVAYTVPPRHPAAIGQPNPQTLRVVRKSITTLGPSDDQVVSYSPIDRATLAGSSPLGPVLLKLGNALHLFYALNIHRSRMESGANGRPVTVHSSFGQVFELLSDDGGGTWSVPELVVRDDRHPDSAAVEALAAATSADGLELFIVSPSGLGLSHLRKSPGSEWSDPQPVLPPRPRFLAASFHVSDVAVNGDGEDAVVAWIDTRHRATSRRIWSPLGGFPWSDHPDYADNDVFALPLDTLTSGRAEASMARLTAPRGYADRVAVAAGPAQTFVVWSGRARVGRYQDSFGAVSELFCDVLSPSFVRQR